MRPSVHWLNFPEKWRLAIMPRPRAGDWLADEVAGWKAEGIDLVVSLLEPHEVAELELRLQPKLCRAADIAFVSFPIADRGVPESVRETNRLVREISATPCGSATPWPCIAAPASAGPR
jgi:hypothetical protein